MRKSGYSLRSQEQHNPSKFADSRWTKAMGKPSTQKLKVNFNHRRTAYARR